MIVSGSLWFRVYIMVGSDARIDIGFGFMRKLGFLSLRLELLSCATETNSCLPACDISRRLKFLTVQSITAEKKKGTVLFVLRLRGPHTRHTVPLGFGWNAAFDSVASRGSGIPGLLVWLVTCPNSNHSFSLQAYK